MTLGSQVFLFVGVGTWVGGRGERASNYQWNAEEELFLLCLCCFKKASLSRFMFPRSLGCPFVCPVSGAAACQATVEETEEEREMKRFCSEAPPQKEGRKSYHLKKKNWSAFVKRDKDPLGAEFRRRRPTSYLTGFLTSRRAFELKEKYSGRWWRRMSKKKRAQEFSWVWALV